MASLRLKNSDLNENLFSITLVESPNCMCGAEKESIKHYLLECPRYEELRNELFKKIDFVQSISEKELLDGDREFNSEKNKIIILDVQTFILKSKRLKS